MTKEELREARKIMSEMDALEQTLSNPKSAYVVVFYKDYSSGTGVPRTDEGEDGGWSERQEIIAKIKQKRVELRSAIERIQGFIDQVEDAETRTILQSYYITGMTQEEIAELLHCERSTVSKRLEKFWRGE